jgi:hypothetical protein
MITFLLFTFSNAPPPPSPFCQRVVWSVWSVCAVLCCAAAGSMLCCVRCAVCVLCAVQANASRGAVATLLPWTRRSATYRISGVISATPGCCASCAVLCCRIEMSILNLESKIGNLTLRSQVKHSTAQGAQHSTGGTTQHSTGDCTCRTAVQQQRL